MITQPINIPAIAAPAVKDGSKFNAIASSISNIFSSAAPIVQAVIPNRGINPGAPAPYYPLPNNGGTAPPPPAEEKKKDNTLMYVGIAASVLVLGIGGVLLAKRAGKKKGVSGLGCPEPEKPTALAGVKKARKTKKRRTKKVRI